MMDWVLCLVIGIMGLAVAALWLKVVMLRRSVREIHEGFADRLHTDTNTQIRISGSDSSVKALAADINKQILILREQRQRYERGDRELREAVANISHDLRTPLTAINGYLELLMAREHSEEEQRYLDIISSRIALLKRLTEELFTYTIFASERVVAYEEIVLNRVLEESIAAFYVELTDAGIAPVIQITDRQLTRRSSPELLSRIFGNILGNAIRYSDGDLSVTMDQSGKITFSNRAEGLDAVSVERLFDRFYTVENARRSTGLGLTIAKKLTEELGGSIAAYYEGKRLSIVVCFPEN